MCVEQLRENDNIVNVDTIEVSKLTKLFVHYSLNVDERIFESYSSDIKLFLISINNEKKLMFVFKRNQELQKKVNSLIKLMCSQLRIWAIMFV